MDVSPPQVALFPLQLVLLPEELLPLHIFEERYKRLVARCLEKGEPFGIVLRLGDGVAAVGCSARLVAVLEQFPDGRSNIVVRGEDPFRILAIDVPEDADQEPLTATVEYLQDEVDDPAVADGAEARLPESLNDLLARLRAVRDDDLDDVDSAAADAISAGDDLPLGGDSAAGGEAEVAADAVNRNPAPRSYRIAADLDLELSFKERLLESRSEADRVAMIADHLEVLVPRLELFETRRDAIRGNGKGD